MRRARKLLGAVAVTVAASAALAAGASASTAGIDAAGVLHYDAAPGDANHLQLYFDPAYFVYMIEDTGVASVTTTDKWCHPYTPQTVYCTFGKFTSIDAKLGDGGSYAADELGATPVTIHGGAGADTLSAGNGPATLDGAGGFDTLTAGSGQTRLVAGPGGARMNGGARTTYVASPDADEIHARQGVAESIACGGGADSVVADPSDTVAADCEAVDRAEAGSTTSPASGTGNGSDGQAPLDGLPGVGPSNNPLVAISRSPVTLDRGGRVPVPLTCPASSSNGCDVVVELSLPARAAAKGRIVAARRRVVVVGRSARSKIAPGKKATVPVALSRRGARMFRSKRHSRRSAKFAVAVSMRTDAGVKVTRGTITVKQRRGPVRSRTHSRR